MKIKIGDRVRFLNESGGGIVRKLVDRQMVEVETEDGWSIPYVISELVIIPEDPAVEPYKAESNPVHFVDVAGSSLQDESGPEDFPVFLLVVQDTEQDVFSGIRMYLVNDSNFNMKFSFYQENEEGTTHVIESDDLDPGTKIFLHELKLADLSEVRGFHVQGVLTRSVSSVIPPLISGYIPYVNKKFSARGAYRENDYLHEPALVYSVTFKNSVKSFHEDLFDKDSEAADPSKLYFKSGKKREELKEIDLHINQLVDSVVGMSNSEIIKVQLNTFHRELKEAIERDRREIVFIHGIGNGTLKQALRKSVEEDYPICSYEDASFRDYGFGATLIRIRQNK